MIEYILIVFALGIALDLIVPLTKTTPPNMNKSEAIKKMCQLIFDINKTNYFLDHETKGDKKVEKEYRDKLKKLEDEYETCLKTILK